MKPFLFSPRKVFIRSVTAIVALGILGWLIWSLAATQYRRVIDSWIEEGRAAGYQISFDDRQVFGFPHHITMRFVNLHWKNADGIDFHTDTMDIAATPWDWQHYEVKLKNHVVVNAPTDTDGHALMLASDTGQGHVTLDDDGVWLAARLELQGTKGGLAPNYLFDAGKILLSVVRPGEAPVDHKQVGLTLEGEADDVVLPDAMPSPFGNKADKFAVRMRVMGVVPDVRAKSSVDAWNKESGIVEFDQFDLHWGELDLHAKGTMGFDDDLQPEGAFAAQVAHADKAMHVLIDKGFIAMHDQDMLAAAMDMFSQPVPKGQMGMGLPIAVQLGGLFVGPIRVFAFPQIVWPDVPPQN